MSYQRNSPAKPLKKTLLNEVFKNPSELVPKWNPIPTGFNNLDSVLNGGLIPQLYILGAESSAGKSTFMINIAEKIARDNMPVMYFSLEMPAHYIARLMICHSLCRQAGGFDKALMINNFTKSSGLEKLMSIYGKKPRKGEKSPYSRAFDEYLKLGRSFAIIERDREHPKINGMDIYLEVERELARLKNKTPVVIVDYLQILGAEKDKNPSDQRAVVDYNVGMLSQITTDLKVPVVVISSLSRGAYSKKRDIVTSDFKESGGIEYSADVLLALRSIGDPVGEIQKRTLMLSILKNRYGEKDTDAWLSFYPQFGLFEDGERPENYEDLINRENTPKPKTAPQKTTEIHEEIETPNDAEDDTEYKRILNSRISVELHKKRDNYGFQSELDIGSEKYVISYLLRKKDDNKDDGADSLTLWDLAVMDAVYAVTDRGSKAKFTINALYKFMCGKAKLSNRSDEITGKFKDALNRLKNREMIIDITDEIEMRLGEREDNKPSRGDKARLSNWTKLRRVTDKDELKSLSESFGETEGRTLVKGTLLSFEDKEESDNSFRLSEDDMPILFEYTANLNHAEIKYDQKLWAHFDGESKMNFTRQKLLIRYYLIRRIGIMGHVKKYSRTINVHSLLTLLVLSDSSKLEKLEDKNIKNLKGYTNYARWLTSVSEDTEMILKDLKKHGYILNFKPAGSDKMSYKIIL